MIPDYIKIAMSLWLILTAVFWTKGLMGAVTKNKTPFAPASFICGIFWSLSGLAPVWGIAMLWTHF